MASMRRNLSNLQLPATFRPSRLETTLLLLMLFAFIAVSVAMIVRGNRIGYLFAGIFALCSFFVVLGFHPRAAYLTLTGDRFTFCKFFIAHTIRWEDACEFTVIN